MTDYCFEPKTYKIVGNIGLYGTTRIMGGAVLKLADVAWMTQWSGTIVTETSDYLPAVLTHVKDGSIGARHEFDFHRAEERLVVRAFCGHVANQHWLEPICFRRREQPLSRNFRELERGR